MGKASGRDGIAAGSHPHQRDSRVAPQRSGQLAHAKAEYEEHPERFENLETLNLKVVTKFSADEEFAAIQRSQQQRVRSWLTRRGLGDLSRRTQVEVFDLRKFAQLMEKLYGVELEIDYREAPLASNGTLLGLADARAFVSYIDREELLAFNIRKFLGIRTGSVNSKIKETLESEVRRANFWTGTAATFGTAERS